MRCRRYLHAAFWIVACVLLSSGSLILQGCGDASAPESAPSKETPTSTDAMTQAVAKHYAGLDATYPKGRPASLTATERHADPTYAKRLNELSLERTRLTKAATEAKAKTEAFADLLIKSQNERAMKAGHDPLNETLKANLLKQNGQYQLLLQQQAEAEAAVAAKMREIQTTISNRRAAAQIAYDKQLSEADAAARAAGLPTRSELTKAQSQTVAE